MRNPDYAFLDLTNIPALGSKLLSTEAVVLFDEDLATPLWANASGADLFGEVQLSDLMEKQFSAATPFIRQLRDAAVQLENEDPIVRGFRVLRGTRAEFTQCMLSWVQLPKGEWAVLVTCADERLFKPIKEHEVAQKLVASLEGASDIVAILDQYGLPIAFSPAFADADFSMDALEEMCREAATSGQMRQTVLRSEAGDLHSVGIVSLKAGPGRLLMVATPAIEEAVEAFTPEAEGVAAEETPSPTQWDNSVATVLTGGVIATGALAIASNDDEDNRTNADAVAVLDAEQPAEGDLELASDIGEEASLAENGDLESTPQAEPSVLDAYVNENETAGEAETTGEDEVLELERADAQFDIPVDEPSGVAQPIVQSDEALTLPGLLEPTVRDERPQTTNADDATPSSHWQLGDEDWRTADDEQDSGLDDVTEPLAIGPQEVDAVDETPASVDAESLSVADDVSLDEPRTFDQPSDLPEALNASEPEPSEQEEMLVPQDETAVEQVAAPSQSETPEAVVAQTPVAEPRKRGPIRALLERWYLGIGGEPAEESDAAKAPTINQDDQVETADPLGGQTEVAEATIAQTEADHQPETAVTDSAIMIDEQVEDDLARSAIEGNAGYFPATGEETAIGSPPADSDVEWDARQEPEESDKWISGPMHDEGELLPWAQKPQEPVIAELPTDDVAGLAASQSEPASEAGSWLTPGSVAAGAGAVIAGAAATLSVESTGKENDGAATQFRYSAGSEPVRFAWTVDDNHIFMSVSPELAQTVGPNAADIVGRKFGDVANVFGFDRYGDIQRLLEKRDTWSGKSVMWPVQGTDFVVPVDLAALPAFSGARQFDGFRGFGIIRPADAVIDPDETGLALADGPMRQPSKAEPAAPGIQESSPLESGHDVPRRHWPLDPELEEANSNISTFPTASGANIVDLGLRKRDRNEELSRTEAKAFQEIGKKLVEDEPGSPLALAPGMSTDTSVLADTLPDPLQANSIETAQASILRKLPVPVLVYRSGETLYANPELLNVTGYSSLEELDAAGGIDALFASQGIAEGENSSASLLCKNGSSINVSPLLQTVLWDDAKALLLSFRAPQHALTDEKTAIDMARVAELQNILDTATDGILVTTRDGLIESLNGPAEALFGVDFREVQNKHLTELFARESHKAVEDYMRELKEPGVAGLINNGREVIGLHHKGGLIPLFITLGRMGKEEKFCAVLRDITPWKKAEEELVSARRAAESASEQKSDFLARVSHEIRTPLNAIIGFSDVMIEERFGPIENDRYRGYLRDINRSGVHVLDLINDLLDISKIEAGKMELAYEAVDLNQLVAETVALLQPQANSERIIIRTSLSRAVPRVVADARSIRQIILNLVSNAIKFTPANGQVIVSTVYEGNGEVVMRVRDTGRGMSEREIEQAMKPFHQINVTDEKRGQGTGLGLPLTKALVEANRAYFDLESTPGEGTIAHVHFPTQRVLAD